MPNLRWSCPIAAGMLALLSMACSPGEEQGGHRSSPTGINVLFITLDTTRADRLGCYGYTDAHTPNLDALAASGVMFEYAFCQAPLTLPSHVSLLTGAYPISTG
ncbi:sulfatase-like hydrolase/transferase, partial [Candidatus Eisenbacteria bacterium]